jgi:release factor glutamine methyltransferase
MNQVLHSMTYTIYEPQEDSYLLRECVEKYARGKVLDMGSGSGIQGLAALKIKNVSSVVFADINPAAITAIQNMLDKTQYAKQTAYIVTDLFKNIKKTHEHSFNTIIFNPPYLPEDPYDNEKDITTGGKEGHEIIEKFLKQVSSYLAPNGNILIVFSSLTSRPKINSIIKHLGYVKHQIAKKRIFLETLFVYKIAKPIQGFKGHRGFVTIDEKKRLAIKETTAPHYDPRKEATFLKKLNTHGIGPKLITYDEKTLTMHYIEGTRIIEYMRTSSKKEIKEVIKKILTQLLTLDTLGLNKREMTNPYKHIIIDNKHNPVMIDFERSFYSEKPKNITQFIQFLSSTKLEPIFKEKNIHIDKEQLRTISKSYKNASPSLSDSTIIKDILACIV